MLEETAGHDLCFVELLGGLQYLSSLLPYERHHFDEFAVGPAYSYTVDFVKSHFHTVVSLCSRLQCVILPAYFRKPTCFINVG